MDSYNPNDRYHPNQYSESRYYPSDGDTLKINGTSGFLFIWGLNSFGLAHGSSDNTFKFIFKTAEEILKAPITRMVLIEKFRTYTLKNPRRRYE